MPESAGKSLFALQPTWHGPPIKEESSRIALLLPIACFYCFGPSKAVRMRSLALLLLGLLALVSVSEAKVCGKGWWLNYG